MDRFAPPRDVDVVVVGARCAGAATALLLARAGARVLVVDRGEYGADTVSTHALMRGSVVQLSRWGLLPRIVEAGTPPVTTTTFHLGRNRLLVPIKPKHGVDALYAPRRTLLDRILVDAAREAGAVVEYGCRVTSVLRNTLGAVCGASLHDRSGVTFDVSARLVIGADGMQSTIADLVDAPVYRRARHAAASLYGYWPGQWVEGYHWFYGDGLSAGAIPTNGGETLIFASLPASRWAAITGADRYAGFLHALQVAAPALRDTVELTSTSPGSGRRALTGFAGRPGYFRQSWGPGWALVGDAGYFKDPLTAHGLTDALRDAELLADAAVDGSAAALAAYQQQRDALSSELFEITDRIASFEWTTNSVGELLDALAREMAAEARAIAARRDRPAAAVMAPA
jgi:flavin-dependent dehydrogenase